MSLKKDELCEKGWSKDCPYKVGPVSRKKNFMKNIEELARMAEQIDIIIGLENPAEGENEIIDSGNAGALIIKEIGSGFVS